MLIAFEENADQFLDRQHRLAVPGAHIMLESLEESGHIPADRLSTFLPIGSRTGLMMKTGAPPPTTRS
jgi:hypothetical protein